MKWFVVISRILAALVLVGACLSAALAVSVYRHADLIAYGLKLSDGFTYLMVVAFAVLAMAWLQLSRSFWRAQLFRPWVQLIPLTICAAFSALSILMLHNINKNEKGESNLDRLATYCRDLPAWNARAAQLRTGILRAANLDPLPARTALNAVFHNRKERSGYSFESVILETIPGFFLPGTLYRPIPQEEGARCPIVIIPQGHFPNGRFNENTQQLAATFARMGALAFSYEMVGRGESTQLKHKNPHALTLQLWNSIRVLDFLLALPDVDPARVGMTGASGGGTQTFLCTAVDDRVTISAPVVMVSSWVYGGCECESGLPIHRTSEYQTNNAEIAALTAPRPQLIVSDDEDWTRTVPQREFPYIRNIYHLFGKADLVHNVHLPGEHHDYGPSKRAAVYRFFAERLGLSLERVTTAGGVIDESPDSVEPFELMRAFDDSHPVPDHVLQEWDEVVVALGKLK